jgi:hypothetical protein
LKAHVATQQWTDAEHLLASAADPQQFPTAIKRDLLNWLRAEKGARR